jgi:hypothetical protein
VHAGSAPVIRLEGPLALGHGVLLALSASPSGRYASQVHRSGCLACWPARSPDNSGSQPYRRLSGDCLRVLMTLRRVKPCLPQRTGAERRRRQSWDGASPNARWPRTRPRERTPIRMRRNGWQPDGKLLASANAVSTEAAVDNEARMADRLAASTTLPVVYSYGDRGPWPLGCGALLTVLSTPVDNYVDSCHQQQFGVGPGRCVVD